jgi:Ran GTPase-activating protein (RanGAP) involved in mRNA processing and transport
MNIIKILGGLLVAVPMAVFAFTGVAGTPVFVNVALAGYGQDKVKVCHNGNTIKVVAPAVPAHLNHGDTLGECPEIEDDENEEEDENDHDDDDKKDKDEHDDDNDEDEHEDDDGDN